MEKHSIRVNIGGLEYALRSNADPQHVQAVAEYVDKKMRQLSENSSVKSQLKIAVLTALNIADEYFRLKARHENLLREIESTSEEITENLDRYLDQFPDLVK